MTAGTPKHRPKDKLATPDLERIASLIEGRLDEPERAEVLRMVAESEAAYEVYAESLALLGGTGKGKPPSVRGAAARSIELVLGDRRHRVGVVAAAAMLALIFVQLQRNASGDALRLVVLADAVAVQPAGVAAALSDDPLPAFRSGSVFGSAPGLAFRLGTRLMEFELASSSGLEGEATRTLDDVEGLLGGLDASADVFESLRSIRSAIGGPDNDARRARDGADASIATWLGGLDPAVRARYQFGMGFAILRAAVYSGSEGYVRASDQSASMRLTDEMALDAAASSRLDAFRLLTRTATLPQDRDRILSFMTQVSAAVSR